MSLRQRGFGLIELMVSLSLGILIAAGSLQIYLGNKQAYRLQEANARLQESARFALSKISYDIRMAGASGCANVRDVVPTMRFTPTLSASVLGAGWRFNRANALTSLAITGPVTGLTNPVPGTEAITVLRASTVGAPLAADMSSPSAVIDVGGAGNFQPGEVLLVADCETADVFRANQVTASGIAHAAAPNAPGGLTKAYRQEDGAQVFRLRAWTYYVSDDSGRFELRRRDLLRTVDNDFPVVDGVENLSLQFGLADGGEVVSRYVGGGIDAAVAGDAVSLRLNLLMRSTEDNLTAAPQSVMFSGAMVNDGAGADRRVRRAFTTHLALRNRVDWQ